jgi:hypothetical protein
MSAAWIGHAASYFRSLTVMCMPWTSPWAIILVSGILFFEGDHDRSDHLSVVLYKFLFSRVV